MPRISNSSSNGHAAGLPILGGNRLPAQRSLAETLADSLPRTDDVTIGEECYVYEQSDDTSSWEDLQRLVSGIKYLVPGFVPFGMLTGVIAEPKLGKSGFVLGGLVRPIVTGSGSWFNATLAPSDPGYAVWCDTEGSAGINVHRAIECGLPLDRIKVPFPDDPLQRINLADANHLLRIESIVCRYRAPLVVIDSLRGAHGEDENNSKVARVLQGLSDVAERTKAAVVLIHHTKKIMEGEELSANSGRGSNAFLAMVRCQLAIDRPDPNSEWRRVRVLGENFGTAPAPVGFRFTANSLEFGPAPARPRRASRRDDAEAWLRERLRPGEWVASGPLLDEAKAAGYSANAVQRARDVLGIVKPNIRKTKTGWEWKLPLPGGG